MNLQGLNKQQVEESRQKHGANTLTQIPPEPLWKKILEGFKDPMIMILLVALVIQVVLCFMGEAHWYEPVGILIAIMIANGVSAISENQQEGKASALKAEEEAKEVAKVLRDGKLMEIHVSEVVVGDLVYLQAGDKISADGEIVQGLVKVDQATLNGETKEATKSVNESGEAYNTKDLLNRCYVYRGTVVCSGEAYMEVKVVGDKTLFGELALEVQEDTRETPLQVKLAKLAKQISDDMAMMRAGGGTHMQHTLYVQIQHRNSCFRHNAYIQHRAGRAGIGGGKGLPHPCLGNDVAVAPDILLYD